MTAEFPAVAAVRLGIVAPAADELGHRRRDRSWW